MQKLHSNEQNLNASDSLSVLTKHIQILHLVLLEKFVFTKSEQKSMQ